MSQSALIRSGLVRVSVASGSRRVDLVLPGAVPVAELVPELARSVGLLDPSTVFGGYRLLTQQGRVLASDTGLLAQGVEDGVLLTVAAGVDDVLPRIYDDVVEAMADTVEGELEPWDPASGRRAALTGGAILVGLAALALLLNGDTLLGGLVALATAGLLVIAGIVMEHARGEPEAAVTVSLLGAVHAAVGGLLLAPGDLPAWSWPLADGFFTTPLIGAGLALLAVGVVSVVGLAEGRALMLPPLLVGLVLAACGLLIGVTGVEAGVVLTIVMTSMVLAGSVFPWLALSVTGTQVEQPHSAQDVTAHPHVIDPLAVSRDARTGHEILLGVAVTVGTLLVLLTPIVVGRGGFGTILTVTCCLAVMLRTRQFRTASEVRAGLLSGVVGLFSAAVSMLLIHEGWRSGAGVVLAVIGAVLLAASLLPPSPSIRRERLADVLETATLVALLPLMVLATGFVSSLAG